MRAAAIIFFSQFFVSNFDGNVVAATNVKRVVDNENGVVCYVLLEGYGLGKGVGISCVKTK